MPLARIGLVRSQRPRVLVVDDDALARRMLVDAFAERGFETLMAPDGYHGLHTLLDQLFTLDVLVSDVKMPRMDGEALLQTIRGMGGEQDLTIAIVSAYLNDGLRKQLETMGADAVLDKSTGPERIADAILALYEGRHASMGVS